MIEIALIHEEPWSGDEQSWEVLATRAARAAIERTPYGPLLTTLL